MRQDRAEKLFASASKHDSFCPSFLLLKRLWAVFKSLGLLVTAGLFVWNLGPACAAVQVTPHRAVYTVSMTSAKNGSQVRAVSGKIEYEWADSCDAWATQQHMTLHFTDIDGQDKEVVSHVLATETKDGKDYRFNIRRFIDGQEDDAFKGDANLDKNGGKANYALPKDWGTKALPEGAMFPTAHTLLIIQRAQAGDKLFSRPVFDGSDEHGIADVSVFISPEKKAGEDVPAALRGQSILSGSAWPVRLAFFQRKDGPGTPDYEMDMTLQPNGVARTLHIDYGDFVVGGTLESIQALPPAACSGGK